MSLLGVFKKCHVIFLNNSEIMSIKLYSPIGEGKTMQVYKATLLNLTPVMKYQFKKES